MEGDRQTGMGGKLDDECMFWTKPRRGGGERLLIKGKERKSVIQMLIFNNLASFHHVNIS